MPCWANSCLACASVSICCSFGAASRRGGRGTKCLRRCARVMQACAATTARFGSVITIKPSFSRDRRTASSDGPIKIRLRSGCLCLSAISARCIDSKRLGAQALWAMYKNRVDHWVSVKMSSIVRAVPSLTAVTCAVVSSGLPIGANGNNSAIFCIAAGGSSGSAIEWVSAASAIKIPIPPETVTMPA